jgi:hypothetical protein
VSGNLPVYEKFRDGGIEVCTHIRLVEGDIEVFRKRLLSVCEAPTRVRVGAFEVLGMHTWKVKEWLTSLGF